MLEILKANVLIAYQQLEQYQLDRYGRGVVSAILILHKSLSSQSKLICRNSTTLCKGS